MSLGLKIRDFYDQESRHVSVTKENRYSPKMRPFSIHSHRQQQAVLCNSLMLCARIAAYQSDIDDEMPYWSLAAIPQRIHRISANVLTARPLAGYGSGLRFSTEDLSRRDCWCLDRYYRSSTPIGVGHYSSPTSLQSECVAHPVRLLVPTTELRSQLGQATKRVRRTTHESCPKSNRSKLRTPLVAVLC